MAIRVIQWATGGVGIWSLRRIIDHPDLELVGVLVYSADKDGVDAGDLCGRPRTGIEATRSKDAILALDADVVIMTPKLPEDDDLVKLLRSGKDVISPLSYFAPEVEGSDRGRRAFRIAVQLASAHQGPAAGRGSARCWRAATT